MKNKKIFLIAVCVFISAFSSLYAQEKNLQQYYGSEFHGNMMGKIITADMKIVDDETIEFTANLPAGKKLHTYTYKIVSSTDKGLVTEWYENEKLDKTVTFSAFDTDNFVMEVKGKGKVKMQKK